MKTQCRKSARDQLYAWPSKKYRGKKITLSTLRVYIGTKQMRPSSTSKIFLRSADVYDNRDLPPTAHLRTPTSWTFLMSRWSMRVVCCVLVFCEGCLWSAKTRGSSGEEAATAAAAKDYSMDIRPHCWWDQLQACTYNSYLFLLSTWTSRNVRTFKHIHSRSGSRLRALGCRASLS